MYGNLGSNLELYLVFIVKKKKHNLQNLTKLDFLMCKVHNIVMAILIKGAKSALKIEWVNSQGKRKIQGNIAKFIQIWMWHAGSQQYVG